MKILFVVESPSKANTIKKILSVVDPDNEYVVIATLGHIRDIDKKTLGIDLETFECTYTQVEGRKTIIQSLRQAAKDCRFVYLASDNDREGESIAWHVAEVLKLGPGKAKRVTFNEVTEEGIAQGLKDMHDISTNVLHAQMTRRIIDRMVGYNMSPLLGREFNVQKLSSGRVQSACLKMIVDREHQGFNQYTQFDIGVGKPLVTEHIRIPFEILESEVEWRVVKVEKKKRKESPPLPFTTSTMQQEAFRKLGFNIDVTMALAQDMYEIGAITYMRTSSTSISGQGMSLIKQHLGLDGTPLGSGTTHEAIRPTFKQLEMPSEKHTKLYNLIMKRTAGACGHAKVFTDFHVTVTAGTGLHTFSGVCSKEPNTDHEVKVVEMGLTPKVTMLNEGSLVKMLDELSIGRPSTYVSTLERLYKQKYIVKELPKIVPMVWTHGKLVATEGHNRVLVPTALGTQVVEYLDKYFGEIIDTTFTRNLELRLDEIENGSVDYKDIVNEFWLRFSKYVNNVPTHTYEEIYTKQIKANSSFVYCIDGIKYNVRSTRYGPVIENPEEKQFISLSSFMGLAGKTLEQVSKGDVSFLLTFPRPTRDGDGLINYGRFGFYISESSAGRNLSVPKEWFDNHNVFEVVDYVLGLS